MNTTLNACSEFVKNAEKELKRLQSQAEDTDDAADLIEALSFVQQALETLSRRDGREP
jgi:hypothetical protein